MNLKMGKASVDGSFCGFVNNSSYFSKSFFYIIFAITYKIVKLRDFIFNSIQIIYDMFSIYMF